jgi:hypothetical protein
MSLSLYGYVYMSGCVYYKSQSNALRLSMYPYIQMSFCKDTNNYLVTIQLKLHIKPTHHRGLKPNLTQ